MDTTTSRRRRRIFAPLVVALLIALGGLAVMGLARALLGPHSLGGSLLPGVSSVGYIVTARGAVDDFRIGAAVNSWPDCATPTLLSPGARVCLAYTITNDNDYPISVTSISIVDVTSPPTCPATELDLAAADFAGAVTVRAHEAVVLPGRPIALLDLPVNQDACQGAAFRLTFTGAAVQFTGAAVQAPDLAPNVTAAGAGGCAPALRAPCIAGCEDARR